MLPLQATSALDTITEKKIQVWPLGDGQGQPFPTAPLGGRGVRLGKREN
jgi:hypothetical protein